MIFQIEFIELKKSITNLQTFEIMIKISSKIKQKHTFYTFTIIQLIELLCTDGLFMRIQ